MNNYSVGASTEEIIELLSGILERADERLNKLKIEHRDMFKKAKEYAYNETQDDERLLELLENYGQYYSCGDYHSNYNRWDRHSRLVKLFVQQPLDDREKYREVAIKHAASMARHTLNTNLFTVTSLSGFYNVKRRTDLRNYSDVGGNYAEDNLMIDLIKSQLPDNMQGRCDMFEIFSNNIGKIREMYQGISIHEFQSVTIEENMLTTIDSVQNEIS